jgi:IMP dehydrogenase/GMP reductase
MTDGTEDEVKTALNYNADSYVYNKIENILTTMSLGSSAFSKLEKAYNQVINTETVGGRSVVESTRFIIDTIENQVNALPETPADKTEIRAKKILARQLAIKLLAKNK